MFKFFFAIFFILPLLEIYVLLKVGGIVGALPTIALVVFTAVLGAILIRAQGLATFLSFQQKVAQGAVPANEMLTGVALLLAGAFLMTPGFVTDTFGFLLLIPALRQYLMRQVFKYWMLRRAHGVTIISQDQENSRIIK